MIVLAILIISLFAFSTVSAADNATDDIAGTDLKINEVTSSDSLETEDVISNDDNVTESQNVLAASDEDEVSIADDDNILSETSPSYSQYSVSVSDTTISAGSSGTVTISITPYSGSGYYAYDFYFRVYDSNGNQKISENLYDTTKLTSYKYTISANTLSAGTYTIKLENYKDGHIMDTATLKVTSSSSTKTYPNYNDYSVSLSDYTFNSGTSGSIYMYITSSTVSTYKYYYYFRVYDYTGSRVISNTYSSTSSSSSRYYSLSSNTLSSGTYTMKIENYYDGQIMDTATLNILKNYPSSTDYSVSLSDYTFAYGDGGSIYMYITPSTTSNYKYYYYFRVYDSSGSQVISSTYSGTSSSSSKYYSLGSNTLSSGTYTMKIENYYDGNVMDIATLKINDVLRNYPYYTDYSVSLSDYEFTYGSSGSIYMYITSSTVSSYKYYYYFKVYDSSGSQVISNTYSSTSSSSSRYYSLGSTTLSPGTYTMKIINYYDNTVMDTATLKILKNYPSSTDYSVSLSDYTFTYGNGGSIYMYITPSTTSNYKYYYYFRVYDSSGSQVIGSGYSDTSSSYSKYYSLGSTTLSPGTYTMKIINYDDSKVMANATLTIKPKETNSYVTSFSGLSDAISSASTYDLIKLNYDISNTDYMSSPIYISKTLTIDGNGHSIDAKGLSGIFSISGSNVILKNIKFKNAYRSSGNGGAIYWSGSNGKLINCTFENNKVDSTYYGGAIYWYGSYGNMTNCKFTNNTAYNGGAIYWSGSYGTINNSNFNYNNADNNGGAIYWSGSYGTINNSNFNYNNADYNGGAISWSGSYGKLTNSNFNYNNATNEGGAIYKIASNTDIESCNFKSNSAEYGGALSIGNSGNNNIINCKFNNNAADYGSAIKWYNSVGTLTNSTFNNARTNYNKYFYIANKLYPDVSVYADDIELGETLNLTISYKNGIEGTMNIKIINIRTNKTVYTSQKTIPSLSDSMSISIPKLKSGDHIVDLTYSGDNIYQNQTDECYFEVIGHESEITFEVEEITWGSPVVLNPKVTTGATGMIDIYLNDEYQDTMKVGSKYNLMGAGGPTSKITLEYLGDDNYRSCIATKTVYVNRLNSSLTLPDVIESGYSIITVTLNEDATGYIQVTINSQTYSGYLKNGTFTFTTSNKLPAGNRYISINYNGDTKYNPISFSQYVYVTIKTPTLILDIPNKKTGNDVIIKPTIDNGATGTFKIYVDGTYKTSISVGNSYTLSAPSVGKHDVRVVYSGDSYYASVENKTSFRIYTIYPIEAKNTQIIYNTDKYLQAKFYDEYGYVLENKIVIFTVNGTDYYKYTNENGIAVLNEKFDMGIYPVTITNTIVNEQKTVILTVFTSIISENLTMYYNSGFDFNATFLDDDATPLSNSIVVFDINGTMYSTKTDGSGYAKLIVPLPVGTYKVKTINTKTDEYTFNKLKIITSIDSSDMTRVYNSTMDYKATFYDVNGGFLKNKTVTFEVDSKKYQVSTNNNGVAILDVCLDEGEYTITSINPVTNQKSTNNLTILERIINNEDVLVLGNEDTYYRVRVIDNNAVVCKAGEIVEFNLNGKVYKIKTDSSGYASLKIKENKGEYTVSATYKGYTVYNEIWVLEKINSISSVTAPSITYGQTETISININPDFLNGIAVINITADNGFEEVEVIDYLYTSLSYQIKGLNASDYKVEVDYIDVDNFYYDSIIKTFKVAKATPEIILTVEEAPFGENSTITVNVPKAEGNVTIKIGDRTYKEYIIEDGVIVKKISDIKAGQYTVSVTYNGNNNFNKASKTAPINITRGFVGFYVDTKNIVYSSDVNVEVYSSYNGKVTLQIGSTTKTIDVLANNDYNVNFGKLNAGKYTVNGKIVPSNNNYEEASDSVAFEVKKATPKLTIKAENIEFGESTKITVSISNDLTGNIKLKLNGKEYTQSISNSKAIFNIFGLNIGKYPITATFDGNTNFNKVSADSSFEVKKIQNMNLAIPTVVSTYDNSFDLGLPDNAGGNVTLTINGAQYSSKVVNGKVKINLPKLNEGKYSYTLKYTGDNKYAGFTKTDTINIAKTTIKSCDMNVNYGSGYDYKTTFINRDGTPLANTQVQIVVNSKVFTVTTDSKGVATLNIGLGAGTYTINAINPKTGEQSTSKLKIIGGVTATKLTATEVSTTYNGGKELTVTLKDVLGNPVNGAIILVNINGNLKILTTNANGQAKLSTNGIAPKTYTVTSTFNGNDKFAKSSVSSKVIVTKAKTKITAAKKTFKSTVKTKKYTVTLKTGKKVIKKAKLILKIKGKKYKATTNKRGKATFKITKLTKKGKFTAKITFKTTKYYKASSKKVKIIIK